MGSAPREKICPHCKTPLFEMTGFCPYCGEKISDEVPLQKEKTIQATADPDLIRRILQKKPALKEMFHIEEPVYAVSKTEKEKKKPQEPAEAGAEAAAGEAEEAPPEEITEEIAIEQERVVDEEIELIAQYGPPPARWWECVSYFLRVFVRKREMKGEIKEISDECIIRKDQLDSELLVIGHRMMRDKETAQKYPKEADAILQGRSRLEATGKERINEEREMEAKEAYLNDEVTRADSQIAAFDQEDQALHTEQQQRSSDMKQARAKIQKYNMEIDKITKLIHQAGRETAQPDLALIERYKFQVGQIERGRAPEESRVAESQKRLGEIDRQISLVAEKLKEETEKLALAKKRKDEVVASLNMRRNEIAAKFHQKHNEYNKCLRELGLAAFHKDDLPADLAGQKEKLGGLIVAAQEADMLLEKHLMALESFDPGVYRKGMILLAVSGGLAGAMLVGLAVGVYFLLRSLFT